MSPDPDTIDTLVADALKEIGTSGPLQVAGATQWLLDMVESSRPVQWIHWDDRISSSLKKRAIRWIEKERAERSMNRLRELFSRLPPGEWHTTSEYSVRMPNEELVATCTLYDRNDNGIVAEFIAEARNNMPALLSAQNQMPGLSIQQEIERKKILSVIEILQQIDQASSVRDASYSSDALQDKLRSIQALARTAIGLAT